MKGRLQPDVDSDASIVDCVPECFCRSCTQCGDLDATHVVLLIVAGEEFIVWLCPLCTGEVTGQDLDATPDVGDGLLPECEYLPSDVLEQLVEHRLVEYRS